MIITNLPQIGNPILRQKSLPVQDFTSPETKIIVENLVDTMRSSNLIGMAAPQIGQSQRIFVAEIRTTEYRKEKESSGLNIFINPVITRKSPETSTMYESCGSVLNTQLRGLVERSSSVEVEAYDLQGQKFSLKAEGLLAKIIQHEYDHLEGLTFLERITDTRDLITVDERKKQQGK